MFKTKIKKVTLFSLFIISIFSISVVPGVATTSDVPISVARPLGTMQTQIHNGFLWLIRNMQSANFTPDNVYFGVYDNTGSYQYPIKGEREQNITLSLLPLKLQLNITIQRMQDDPSANVTVLNYLESLALELRAHNYINIYNKVNADLQITSHRDKKAVSIFYDNDRSVFEVLDQIKNNEEVTSQPFTGDEILTNVFMDLQKDEVLGTYEVWNQWQYQEDGLQATLLKDLIEKLAAHRLLVRELNFLYELRGINIMRTLLGPEYYKFSPGPEPRTIERGRFAISQLKIDELTLHRIGNNLVIQDYEYTYFEHHLLGSLVYNDTNMNGYMDIGVKNATIGQYNVAYPSIGDEALFRFDMEDIETREYQRPVSTENVLEFGSEFTNVEGYLRPIGKNADYSMFDVSTEESYLIDEVSTLFHFHVNNTEGSVELKFDYVLGEWSNYETLEGLSFNQLMASTVVDGKKERIIQWRNSTDSSLDDEFENASQISKFRFADSEAIFGEIRLDDIPYTWDGTEEVDAVGQLIPMNLIDITFGTVSSEADMIRSFRADTQRKTFLYSVSYPKWDGKSIVHDPTYAVVGGIAAETDPTGGVIPGFEFASLFFTIPILALVENHRRKRK